MDTNPDSNGVLASIRLVGVAYYSKNRGAFDESTPVSFYNSFSDPNLTTREQHIKWYHSIRSKVWERISFENQLPPSVEALELHWLRTIWVVDYWSQASQSTTTLLP